MDYSDKAELADLSRSLQPVARRAAELGIDWLLIGAAARDLILEHMHGLRASRATFDVDVAIQVGSWEDYAALTKALIKKDGARILPDVEQRLIFSDGAQIDVVPFGAIEQSGEIAWPPDGDSVMNVLGLAEAFEHSVAVVLPEELVVRVPTVEHFICLKLFAWSNRHLRKPRHDSSDLADVLGNAEAFIELELLYDQHESVMEACEFDSTRAVLQVIGDRLKRALRKASRSALVEILHAEVDEEGRLELIRELGAEPHWIHLLRALLRGLGLTSTAR